MVSASGGSQTQTALAYHAGWHMVPCLYAPESRLYKMVINDVEVFSGDVLGHTEILVEKPDAFGGFEKEGGVLGYFGFLDGNPNQEQDQYLVSVLGDVPAYRGVVSIVAYKPYLQANNPYLFPIKSKIGCFHTNWYEEKLKIFENRTVFTTVPPDDTDDNNYDEYPESSACTWTKYRDQECTIPGYPEYWEFPNGAIIDDPSSWICDSDKIGPIGEDTCRDYRFVGTSTGASPTSQETVTSTQEDTVIGVNGVHIIRETLVNSSWGRGISELLIDDEGFRSAADQVFDEKLGISIAWNKQSSVDDFLQVIVDHIGAVITTIPGSGLYTIRLIRDNQSSELSIGADNILVFDEYEEKGWAGTANELTIKYTDIDDGKAKSVTVHDLAAIERQGDIIHETRNYPGIPTISLAQKIANRDLTTITSSGAKISITTDRKAYTLLPGMIFDVTWPEYGLNAALFRAVDVDYGTQEQNQIRISAISDSPISTIFSNDSVVTVNPPASGASTTPLNANPRTVFEAPYWHVAKSVAETGFPDAFSDYDSLVLGVGGKPQPTAIKFSTLFKKNSEDPEVGSPGHWSGSVLTLFALNETSTDIFLDKTYFRSLEKLVPGALAVLGKKEIVEIVEFDLASWRISINRGMLDTVPVEHAGSTLLNTIDYSDVAYSYDYWLPNDLVTAWFQTTTSSGTLPIEDAAEVSYNVVGSRQGRPLPPGGFSVNGQYLGTVFTGPLTISWTGRNRLTQTTDAHITQQDGNVIPEDGTSYVLEIYGDEDTLLTSVTLEGVEVDPPTDPVTYVYPTEYLYPTEDEIADAGTGELNDRLRIILRAERDGYPSWTAWNHVCYRAATSGPANPDNNYFSDGVVEPWDIEYGSPVVRPTSEMPFAGAAQCGSSMFMLGNQAGDTSSGWSVSQVLSLSDYTSPDGIAQGLTVLEITTMHRAITHGSICEVRVDYFDETQSFLSSEVGEHFYFEVGTWGQQVFYASSPPGAHFAKIVITELAGSEGVPNDGYVDCITVAVYGRLGESVYVTALAASAVVETSFDVNAARVTALGASAVVETSFDANAARVTALSISAVVKVPV